MTDTSLIFLTSDAEASLSEFGATAGRKIRDAGLLPRLLGHGAPIDWEWTAELLDPVEDQSLTRDLLRYWRLLQGTDQSKGLRIRSPKVREFGHPREWESDKSSEIVEAFVSMRMNIEAADLGLDKGRKTPLTHQRLPTSRQAVVLQAAVTYLHQRRHLLHIVESETIRTLIALYTEISSRKELHEPAIDRAACPRCGSPNMGLSPGETDREVHCMKCGYAATREDSIARTKAALRAIADREADSPVLVPIQFVINHYGVPRSTVDSWLRRKKLKRYGGKTGIKVDKREVDAILQRDR